MDVLCDEHNLICCNIQVRAQRNDMVELFSGWLTVKLRAELLCFLLSLAKTVICSENIFLGANIVYAVNCGNRVNSFVFYLLIVFI